MGQRKAVVPISTYTKAQIVARVEARIYKHLIDPTVCVENCSCATCFHKRLDALVDSSAAAVGVLSGR